MIGDLFKFGFVELSSGRCSQFKIDCDALTIGDTNTLAQLIARKFRFSDVIGIPTGGDGLAHALQNWTKEQGPLLIVDDVLTTGASMEKEKNKYPHLHVIGVVIFARGPCPSWIYPMFNMCDWVDDFEKDIVY
jgi:orotate phosphoribosyltransferase